MDSGLPCTLCREGGHRASHCPELYQPEKVSGGGGGGHDHDEEALENTCYTVDERQQS